MLAIVPFTPRGNVSAVQSSCLEYQYYRNFSWDRMDAVIDNTINLSPL